MAKLEEGHVLQKRYRIIKVIGSGGISTVYLAQDELMPKTWAVKEFCPSHLTEEEAEKIGSQFDKEVKILSALNDPRLPKIADSFTEDGCKYIVMEYFEGETLEDVLQKEEGFLPEDKVRKWALHICETLDYLHSQTPPVIHRDIKPGNLIITPEGEIKFLDFGIARIFNPVKKQDTLFMGTPGFASPEQFGRGQTDPRSDIYSFGATIHYLLSKHNPGLNPFKFAPLSVYNPSVSKELEDIIVKAVEVEPSYRFSSVREVILVLSGKVSLRDLPSTPWPVIEPSEVLLHNLPYKKSKKVIKVKNIGGGTLKGQIKTENKWIIPEKDNFEGNYEDINVSINPEGLDRGEKHYGNIEVITNFMKKSVPVEVTFVPPFLQRLPAWAICIILWLISSVLYVSWAMYFSSSSLLPFCSDYDLKYESPFYWLLPPLITCILIISSLAYNKLYVLTAGGMFSLLFYLLFQNFISFILLISIDICIIFLIHERLSFKQKEEVKVPLISAIILIPTIISFLMFDRMNYFSRKDDVISIIVMFLVTLVLMLLYHYKRAFGYMSSFLEKMNLSFFKRVNLPEYYFQYRGYIFFIIAGIIWGLAGSIYGNAGVDVRRIFSSPWTFTAWITHITLFIPGEAGKLNFLLALILAVFMSLTLFIALKKNKYGNNLLSFFIILIFISSTTIFINKNSLYIIKNILTYPSYMSRNNSVNLLYHNYIISSRAKLMLMDYDFNAFTGFFPDERDTEANLVRRIDFLAVSRCTFICHINDNRLKDVHIDKINYNGLEDFKINDNLFNIKHELRDGDIILNTDGDVYASLYYYVALGMIYRYQRWYSREDFMLNYKKMIKYLNDSLEIYNKINNNSYQDRIKEIKFRLLLADKYNIKGLDESEASRKKIAMMHFELAEYLKQNNNKRIAMIEIKQAYEVYGFKNTESREFMKQCADFALNLDYVPHDNMERDFRDALHQNSNYVAMRYYKELLKFMPGDKILPFLGRAYFNLYDYRNAGKTYELIKRDLKPEEKLFLARACYEEPKDRIKAFKYYSSALEAMGCSFPAEYFYDMAVCMDNMGKFETAKEYYKRYLNEAENIPDDLKKSVQNKIEGRKNGEMISFMEFHRNYVKITIFMKNSPVTFLDYPEFSSKIYDLKHSEGLEVNISNYINRGSPVERINITYNSQEDRYYYISFKKYNIEGLERYVYPLFNHSCRYVANFNPMAGLEKCVYILATTSDISIDNLDDRSNDTHIDTLDNGWSFCIVNRSRCSRISRKYISSRLKYIDIMDISFSPDIYNIIGLSEITKSDSKGLPVSILPDIMGLPVITYYNIQYIYHTPLGIPSAVALIAVPYIVIFLYRKRKKLKEENMRIDSIMENLGYFPMDMAEEFFERAGIKIKDKKMGQGIHYDLILIESEKRALKKYGSIPVKCFNTIDITFEEINFPENLFDKNTKNRLAVIIVPEHLPVKNKFHIGDIRTSTGIIIAHITLDDVKNALFDEYSGRETDGTGIRSLINDRINIAEGRDDLYYYTKKITDPVMFYGRKEICNKIISDLERGINTGIFGLRKIGKSSLNMYLQRQLRRYEHFYPVVISLQRSTATAKGIFQDIIQGLRAEIKGKKIDVSLPLLKYDVNSSCEPEEIAKAFKEYIGDIKKLLPEDAKIVLFMDEIDLIIPEENNSKNDTHFYTVFSTIKSIWEENKSILMIVQGFDTKINTVDKFRNDMPHNPVFRFFSEINLSALSRHEADGLVEGIGAMMGINYTEENLTRIYKEAGGHPFLTRLMCSALLNIIKENNKIASVSDELIDRAVNYCLSNYTDYFGYLDGIIEEKDFFKFILHKDYYADDFSYRHSCDRLQKLGVLNKDNELTYSIYKKWIEKNYLKG